jgi:hypothetical protein
VQACTSLVQNSELFSSVRHACLVLPGFDWVHSQGMIRSVFFQDLIAPLRLVQASPCVLSHDSKGPRPKKNAKHVRGETAPRSKASSRCLIRGRPAGQPFVLLLLCPWIIVEIREQDEWMIGESTTFQAITTYALSYGRLKHTFFCPFATVSAGIWLVQHMYE